MKNILLIQGAVAALFLVSTAVGAEEKYPASDFKPTIVYQDEEAAKTAPSAGSASTAASSTSTSGGESQYPAANFQPKVLYSDETYKHAEPSYSSSAAGGTSNVPGVSAGAPAAVQKEESSVGYLLGLIVLGVAGFVLYKKGALGAIGPAGGRAPTAGGGVSAGGLTGVGRYILRTSGTGVSRYIEKHAKSAAASSATGVAKYLAKQAPSAKSDVSQAATGVEKYLRNKG